jgi:hypothetical protein
MEELYELVKNSIVEPLTTEPQRKKWFDCMVKSLLPDRKRSLLHISHEYDVLFILAVFCISISKLYYNRKIQIIFPTQHIGDQLLAWILNLVPFKIGKPCELQWDMYKRILYFDTSELIFRSGTVDLREVEPVDMNIVYDFSIYSKERILEIVGSMLSKDKSFIVIDIGTTPSDFSLQCIQSGWNKI